MSDTYKKLLKVMTEFEDERNISVDVVIEALKESLAKAYKKDSELSDIDVYAEINEKTKQIELFQRYNVVEDVEDDELEMEPEDAKQIDPNAEVGGTVSRKIDIDIRSLSRPAISLAKNVMRQKIREAEKVAVYDEYIDQLHEMVLGIVESVKEKFTLVNLGKTVAMMPHSAAIPGERLTEGQKLRVVITEVNKETKGSQVLVSRADPMLVKRLFEKEVPEIYQGIVEIKAIAREAGERTKMAVISRNPDVDAIGSCIGPRGNRVQGIIEELHGEKIDIFEWNDDLTELVRNALAPATVEAVIPEEDEKSLLVVVDEDQLSLAIGKRGKNARLAVKLTGHKIDIKTRKELEEKGYDYDQLLADAEIRKEKMRKEAARREIERLEAEQAEAEKKRLEAVAKLNAQRVEAEAEEEDVIPVEMQEVVSDRIRDEIAMKPEDEETQEEEPAETPAEETEPAAAETPAEAETPEETEPEEPEAEEQEEEEEEEEAPAEEKTPASKKHADLEEMAAKNTYVSRFEKLTDTFKSRQSDSRPKRRKKKNEEEDYKVNNKELEEQIRNRLNAVNNGPLYTEEELAEIEAQQQEEEDREYDIDYDEYEEYYDEDDN